MNVIISIFNIAKQKGGSDNEKWKQLMPWGE